MLPAKGQQVCIETSCALVIIQGDKCKCQAYPDGCSREYPIRQQLQNTLQAHYGCKSFLVFPQRGLDEAEETDIVHHLSQTTLQVLTCQYQRGLKFAFSNDVIFSLVSKKPLELVQESRGHGARQVLDNGSCSFYLPLCLRPLALRSEEEDQPGIGCS